MPYLFAALYWGAALAVLGLIALAFYDAVLRLWALAEVAPRSGVVRTSGLDLSELGPREDHVVDGSLRPRVLSTRSRVVWGLNEPTS